MKLAHSNGIGMRRVLRLTTVALVSSACLNRTTHRIDAPVPGFAHSPPQSQQPLYVRWEKWKSYFADPSLERATFVQIGANCGLNTPVCALGGDPVWTYATQCQWQGVPIEPIPRLFRKLVEEQSHTLADTQGQGGGGCLPACIVHRLRRAHACCRWRATPTCRTCTRCARR